MLRRSIKLGKINMEKLIKNWRNLTNCGEKKFMRIPYHFCFQFITFFIFLLLKILLLLLLKIILLLSSVDKILILSFEF
jgi:hypothetical protein